MKSDYYSVSENGAGMNEALIATERFGEASALDKKSLLRLRLLSEELFGLIRGIAGDIQAVYRIVAEGKSFELHLKAAVKPTKEIKEQFLAVSTSGQNDASKGFMGRIKVMIASVLFSAKDFFALGADNASIFYPVGDYASENDFMWSMAYYKNKVNSGTDKSLTKTREWDELEKSIVANIADDVKVRIVGENVEVVVYKKFD